MVANFLAGGAVVNAFAAEMGAEVVVIDVGVAGRLDPAPGLWDRKVRRGTADLAEGPAMTLDEALPRRRDRHRGGDADGARLGQPRHRGHGDRQHHGVGGAGLRVHRRRPEAATGRGTGVDDPTWERKVAVVARASARVPEPPATPRAAIAALAEVGGLEHAALAGFVLGAAAHRTPVILDGAIAGAAALVAAALCPAALEYAIAGHVSQEAGHALALRHLGLRPLLGLDLRLGEGTGALLALPLVAGAARALRDVATFDGGTGLSQLAR